MIEYPVYEEIAEIGVVPFIIRDLSIDFLIKTERNPELWSNYNLIKDTTDLADEDIESMSEENLTSLLEHINDISKTDDGEDESKISIEETVALLISRGHLHAHTYRIRFFRTAVSVLGNGLTESSELEEETEKENDNFSTIMKMMK